jgi:putative SOS response-associated peptidase YedK
MCGRFTLHRPARDVADNFGLFIVPWITPHYNIAPTQSILTVRADGNGVREGALLRWGLVLPWADSQSSGPPLFNARSETAPDKPAFRGALKSRRCLVPADGFFEWKVEGKGKVPHYFRHAEDRLLAFAGLWECWEREGQVVESVAILTTGANELVRPLHDRMPVILPAEVHALWLDPARKDVRQLQELLVPFPAEAMSVYPVGSVVSSVKNDSEQCIAPLVSAQRSLF